MTALPSPTCASHARAIVDEMAGQLAPPARRSLRAHVRGCAHCKAAWDRAAAAERAALGEARHDRAWTYLASELGAADAPRAAVDRRAWLGALGAATAVGAVIAALAVRAPRDPDDDWGARGQPAVSSAQSLRVLRARPAGDGYEVRDLGTRADVSVGDQIIPLVTNAASSPRTVTLWIARKDEAPRRLGEPRAVPAGAQDVRVDPVRVEAAWAGEDLTVWAVFEDGPARAEPPSNGGLAKDGPNGLSMRKIMVRVMPEATP